MPLRIWLNMTRTTTKTPAHTTAVTSRLPVPAAAATASNSRCRAGMFSARTTPLTTARAPLMMKAPGETLTHRGAIRRKSREKE